MRFQWTDYASEYEDIVNSWIDEEALKHISCNGGWAKLIEDRSADEHYQKGVNFWCKVVSEEGNPLAVLILYLIDEGSLTVCEFVVKPDTRGKGIGTTVVKELLSNGDLIIGKEILRAGAVIYPSNTASIKAFTRAGFYLDPIHSDDDILVYKYEKE